MTTITLKNIPDDLYERLGRIRSLRPRIDPQTVGAEEILAAIDEGRP